MLKFLLAASILLIPAHASAADEKSSLLSLPTSSKTVYLLFHKMTKKPFDADSAVRGLPVYQNAVVQDQPAILAAQKAALATDYANIDPEKQLIVLRTSVQVAATISPHPGLKATIPDPLSRPASAIYFPYSWAGMNFALIPDKLAPFLDVPLKVTEATAATAKIRDGAATLVIEMLPLSADKRSALNLDGVSQWLLMTKIVSVAYYNQSMQTIWQWQSPGYKRADAPSALLELKR